MGDEAKKVSKNRQVKEGLVTKLSEKVGRAKLMVFTNYQGMTHLQIEGLKRASKAVDGEFAITKNTLLRIALEQNQKTVTASALQKPTATLLAYSDPIAPLKELSKVIKALKLPLIKLGIFEGKEITEAEVLILATLPSREVLIAKLLGTMQSPIYGLHRALSWNIKQFVMTLKAIETKKQ